jgi:outer membrane protein OmpA-like peptidoglycan-associated protein
MKHLFAFIFFLITSHSLRSQTKTTLYFESDKAELTPASIHTLDSVSKYLKTVKEYIINVNAYCDNSGNEKDNQLLSDKRAAQVAEYLKISGLIPALISGKGFSANDPAAGNTTEHGKAMNRRAELLITIKKEEPVVVIEPEIKKKEEPVKLQKIEMLSDTLSTANLAVGKILVLKNLNFEGGTSKLLPESKPSLKLLLKLMKDNPTMEIEIEGHVCCANDMPLSVDRALTVLEYLVNNGVKESRLKYAGHSNYNPLANESSEEGRIQNRRVEIMILKK